MVNQDLDASMVNEGDAPALRQRWPFGARNPLEMTFTPCGAPERRDRYVRCL
jgi:hypothetical protein